MAQAQHAQADLRTVTEAGRRNDTRPQKGPGGDTVAIDFTLSAAQLKLQRNAREFATEILQKYVREADLEPDPQKAFQMTKGAYIECYKLGFLPREYGGCGVSNVDLQIIVEEITAIDPGFATVLLVNGLALMPLVWFGTEEQKRKWIVEATRSAWRISRRLDR